MGELFIVANDRLTIRREELADAGREKEALMQELLRAKAVAEGLMKKVKYYEKRETEWRELGKSWERKWREREEALTEVRRLGVDRGTQSEGAEVAAAGTQTTRRSYASVAAQAGEEGTTRNKEDQMDMDGLSRGSRGESNMPADSATKATEVPAGVTPMVSHPVRAFVVHGVACSGPWAHRSREMEKAFGRRGGCVLGCSEYCSGAEGGAGHLPQWWSI